MSAAIGGIGGGGGGLVAAAAFLRFGGGDVRGLNGFMVRDGDCSLRMCEEIIF